MRNANSVVYLRALVVSSFMQDFILTNNNMQAMTTDVNMLN